MKFVRGQAEEEEEQTAFGEVETNDEQYVACHPSLQGLAWRIQRPDAKRIDLLYGLQLGFVDQFDRCAEALRNGNEDDDGLYEGEALSKVSPPISRPC